MKVFELNNLKTRPVVVGTKRWTRKLSQLIYVLLKPFLKHIKDFIHNSFVFRIHSPRDVDKDTFDVITLYTSIPHKFGLEVLDYFLSTYQEKLHPRLDEKFVLESANFVLKNHTLTFDPECYLQIKETPMGKNFAPTHAN